MMIIVIKITINNNNNNNNKGITWRFEGILFICALVVSFPALALRARAANDTTRAQINNIREKSHVIDFNIFIQDDHFSYSGNCYQHGSCVHNTKDSHNTGNFTPYTFRIVFGFFNVPHVIKHGRYCETGPTVYSPYPRRLESLTICWCNYKGSTFYSVILRPWVLVRPELNSRPPAWQTDAQSTEPPVRVIIIIINKQGQMISRMRGLIIQAKWITNSKSLQISM